MSFGAAQLQPPPVIECSESVCWRSPQEAKRAAKAVERQEELRQASINQPLSASGIKLPPDKPYVHDGEAVLAAVRAGDAKKLLLLCDGTAVASDASAAEKGARDSISRRQTNADVDFIPVGDDPDLHEGPAVHVATARGDSAMLSALLSKSGCGADVDLFNPRTGYTPLHLAVAQDDPAMVRLLIEVSVLPAQRSLHARFACAVRRHIWPRSPSCLAGAIAAVLRLQYGGTPK